MARFILNDGSEFAGAIIRPVGKRILVEGLITWPDGSVSDLRGFMLDAKAIEELVEVTPLEEKMIEMARDYQPEETVKPEPPKPPRWHVTFKPVKIPAAASNIEVIFAASLPRKERAEAKAVNVDLEKGEAIVQLPANPLEGYLSYEYRGRRIKRALEIRRAEAIENE